MKDLKHNAMEYQLKQIIKNLKDHGIEDITTEDVVVTSSKGQKLKVRFYTEEKWLSDPTLKATTAQIVMNQAFKGCKIPDHALVYGGVAYLVKVIK